MGGTTNPIQEPNDYFIATRKERRRTNTNNRTSIEVGRNDVHTEREREQKRNGKKGRGDKNARSQHPHIIQRQYTLHTRNEPHHNLCTDIYLVVSTHLSHHSVLDRSVLFFCYSMHVSRPSSSSTSSQRNKIRQ